jgi:aminopeptidase N
VLDGVGDGLDGYADVTLEQLAYFEEVFGPYPFERYGLALADSMPGLGMETQGRSLLSAADFDGTLGERQQRLLAHELAHQWFGDAVSPATWDDIWLNEGVATYAEWLWLAELGGADVDALADAALAALPPSGWPLSQPAEMFGEVSYRGGAVALHAIRRTIGDEAFFDGLRSWVAQHDDGVGTTDGFQAVMESASGRDLDEVFADWVHADRIPDRFPGRD